MARKTNIVSFDDAKSKSRRGSAMRAERGSRAVRASRTKSAGRGNRAERAARAERSARTERATRAGRDDRAARAERATRSARAEQPTRSDREARKRERTKARADKMFSKQFVESAPSDASAEGAPRPALYEGKMGSTHRRSARMQRSASAGAPMAKLNMSGWFSSVPLTPRLLKVGTAVLCMFLFCTFLYVPAQHYYQAQREHDRIAAEYSTIEDRNEALDVQNDILASDAGMEDAVRQKYGYIKKGEQVAAVAGLSERATDSSRGGENIEASVLAGSVRAPEEWYTPFLDAFFGVE